MSCSLIYLITGGLSTLVASFLARMRGSGEPELSIKRCKDLDQFIRDCEAFQMDHGHITGSEEDDRLMEFRRRFEELLGNPTGSVINRLFLLGPTACATGADPHQITERVGNQCPSEGRHPPVFPLYCIACDVLSF